MQGSAAQLIFLFLLSNLCIIYGLFQTIYHKHNFCGRSPYSHYDYRGILGYAIGICNDNKG